MAKAASLEDLSEEQLRTAAALYRSLVTSPETRETTLRATKKLFPDMAVPEIDTADAIKRGDEAREARIAALESARISDEADRRIEGNRSALRDRGYSKAQIEAIEKLMVDEKIPSHELARKLFDSQNLVATPTPDGGGAGTTFRMPENPLKASRGGRFGLRDWARNEANAALREIHSGRVKVAA